MKKNLLLILLFWGTLSFAQTRTIPYDFPIKPRTDQWKFNSEEEMYNKCQIPPDILDSLTTEALAKTCLSYPLFGLMNAYNTPQAGFYAVQQIFNGINALLERKDAGNVLLNIYKNMNPTSIDKSWTSSERGEFSESFRFIEILFSQSTIQNTLDDEAKKMLLRETKLKYDGKKTIINVYGNIGLQSSLFPAAKIIDKKGLLKNKKDSINHFLETGQILSEADLIEIYNQLIVNQ